jgi:hypothetical protein
MQRIEKSLNTKRLTWYPATTLWSAWIVGLALSVSAAELAAREEPAEKCVLAGIARDQVTKLPVAKIAIRMIPWTGRVGYSGTTDGTGAFHFEGVEAGDYGLEVERTGYSGWVLATQSGHSSSKLHFAPGQTVNETELWLTPDSGIAGIVLGPDGEPLPEARLTLIARRWQRGKRVYMAMRSEETNHAGVYRFPWVEPGRYFVYCARPWEGPLAYSILEAPGKPEMRISGRYYPDASQLDGAAPVDVRAGEEISGIDFRLPLVPVFHLRGKADLRFLEPNTSVILQKRLNDDALDWGSESASVGRDGEFDIAGVTPGSYFLLSLVPGRGDVMESAKIPVNIPAQDVAGMTAPPIERFQLRGRIHVEDGASAEAVPVTIFCEGSGAGNFAHIGHTTPKADGTFVIQNLPPDRYSIRIGNTETRKDADFYLKSVRVNSLPIAGTEIDLTGGPPQDVVLILNSGVGSVEGTVRWPDEDSNAQSATAPAAELTLVVIPENVPCVGIGPRTAALDQGGNFRATNLAPGRYRAFALTNYDSGLWQNAEFVRQIASRGAEFEVLERGSARVEVPILPPGEVRQVEALIK